MNTHHKRKEAISEALGILKKRRKSFYAVIAVIFLAIFILSFVSGWQLYFNDRTRAIEILKSISENFSIQIIMEAFQQHNYFAGFLLILGNNIKSIAILLFSGVFFILPAFFAFFQAIGLGIIMGISCALKPPVFWHMVFAVIVGLLEFTTVCLACYEGMKLGLSFIIKNKKGKKEKRIARFKNALVESLKIFVLIIAILFVAAAIETIGIILFSSKNF